MDNFRNTIYLFSGLLMTILVPLNSQTNGSISLMQNQKFDITNKAQELGSNKKKLQDILNSSVRNGGGDPLPEAMQEKFFTGQTAGDVFGSSVTSAGDVNGDGYDDIIVGAPNNDAGGNNAGRAYIYFGGAVINQLADVTLTGLAAVDLFGISVSGAGDVNGDGYADVIVGATGNDAGGSNAGSAYIFFGSSNMNNVADVILTGTTASDNFGVSVSGCGDVNGDGYSDVIVGATLNDAGGSNAGRAYIYLGAAVMNNIVDVTLTGAAASDNFGVSVSGGGDLNGDGYSDVIVGANLNDAGGSNAGRAYLFYGSSSMDNTADLILTGGFGSDNFGISVSNKGDVNGDGYSDVIVGAYLNDAGGINAGRAYIFFGGAVIDDIADVVLTGTAADDWFGYSVSSSGDINGDGYSDVIVGAHMNSIGGTSAGRVFVYFGGQSMDNIIDVTLTGETAGDQFGYYVSTAGDVNGDGYADLLAGSNLNDAGGSNAGRAYLYLNSLTGSDIPDEFFTGEAAGDEFGTSVSEAGDVNRDGYADLIVSAKAFNSFTGKAYIYLGGAALNNIADVVMTGETANDHFGYSVSGAGDVNGDGYSDVIVGAPGNDAGGSSAGRVYIYFGGIAMDNIADIILTGEAVGIALGISVSFAGDVNGDGYSDVIAGGDGYSTLTGRAYIYFGGTVMNNIADAILTGEATSDQFGNTVSSAGDVNGDGYSDVIVGANGNDAGGNSAGRAYIYFGGVVMNSNPDVILTGEADSDSYGFSVSEASDINGDGYSDVIVGAYLNDAGGTNAGRAYIYFGGTIVDNVADIILTGLTNTRFGKVVSSAEDLNKDGYSDVIVGSDFVGTLEPEKAYIYFGGVLMDNIADIVLTAESAFDDGFSESIASAGDINGDEYSDVIVGAYLNDAGGNAAGRVYLYLSSSPPIQPRMLSVKDIPFDQGGKVFVNFVRSGYDAQGGNNIITEYLIELSNPPGINGFSWIQIGSVQPVQNPLYTFIAETPNDSMTNHSGTYYFRVTARTSNPNQYWRSNILSGHSVDNLSPSMPLNFYANIFGADVKLGWKANTESDLYNYVIYRTDVAGANPDTLEIYALTFDTTYIDINPLSGTSYYFLRAQDVHNNLSVSASSTVSALTFSLSVAVMDGWNMTSVPGLHPTNQNVNTWWQFRNPLADVFRWTTTYEPVTITSPTEGYWMLHSGSITYNTGDEWPAIQTVPHNPIAVTAGWNLIGGYENSASIAGLTTTPPGLIVPNTVYGWNGTYYNVTNLEPGYGYWILLSGTGVINLPTLAASPKVVVQDDMSKWGKISITDASGKSYILYLVIGDSPDGGAKINLDHYQMPPLPPAGAFDVRYSSNRKAENLQGGNQTIEMRGLIYPVTLRVDNANIKLQDETGKTFNASLKSGEEVSISNSQINKLLVSENVIPINFALEQNYPNPFNPSTSIRFSLPVQTQLKINIYNILGELVKTVSDGLYEAGFYSITFDASELSSGTYIYRLESNRFILSRKMLMLK